MSPSGEKQKPMWNFDRVGFSWHQDAGLLEAAGVPSGGEKTQSEVAQGQSSWMGSPDKKAFRDRLVSFSWPPRHC